jgi:hypothetical protein
MFIWTKLYFISFNYRWWGEFLIICIWMGGGGYFCYARWVVYVWHVSFVVFIRTIFRNIFLAFLAVVVGVKTIFWFYIFSILWRYSFKCCILRHFCALIISYFFIIFNVYLLLKLNRIILIHCPAITFKVFNLVLFVVWFIPFFLVSHWWWKIYWAFLGSVIYFI